ncbi:MAG TPA: acyl-CoA dehydrogenase family protein, partial [Rhodocyclaceae bacterium]|nr:acyl-CoA dehydrogenase family protein [Rhodocyclaceae bacterium]
MASLVTLVVLILAVLAAAVVVILSLPPLRRTLVTRGVFATYRKVLPQMSETERDALEAGTVWWEGELFRGDPDWKKLLAYPRPVLTATEQAFLDQEVNEACRLVNDWSVSHEDHDLSPEAWRYIKEKGFLGMIIPRRYGGLEFSAYAHSQVVTRLSTRSSALAVSVMVPNSLGPAELLLHYGTEEQKNHYLPRLAKGVDVPAFALTSPWAGSDAAAIPDFGIVCRGIWQGKEVLGMRVTWDKRYITLAPVCT